MNHAASHKPHWPTTKKVPVARPWPGREARARCASIPTTTNVRYHNFTWVAKGKDVKGPTFLAEVRLLFQNSSPCPALSRETGLREQGFPEESTQAEQSGQTGVCPAGPTPGRDQGCQTASRRPCPHASLRVAGARVSASRCPRCGSPAVPPAASPGQGPSSFRQLVWGDLLGSGGWFFNSSWGSVWRG